MAKPISLDQIPVVDRNTTHFLSDIPFSEGVILPIDKPPDWTSFDVVKFVRNRLPVRKVGHAGTLDPLATGLLLLCCGKATKSISQIQDLPKTYVANITFGTATSSFDRATKPVESGPVDHLNLEQIKEILDDQFTGTFEQIPPVFSALKKDGQRYYKLARKGKEIVPDPRMVEVFDLEILRFELPELKIKIKSGKGFYVRSFANDLGKKLGTFAYLSDLRRTATGQFSVENAWNPDQFNKWSDYG